MFTCCMTIIIQDLLNAVLHSYVDIKDSADDSGDPENEVKKLVQKKPGRKPIIGGSSRDVSHTLRTYSALIKYLLVDKKFLCVLPGYMNNNRIERYFGLMRYLSGMHMTLDISSFCKNVRTHLLWTISELCKNKDGSHKNLLYKSFFEEAQKLTD